MELNPSIALKIAHGTLDFKNLLDSLSSDLDSLQELNILQNKSLVFVFREDSLLSFEVSDIIEIPETFPESGPESMNFTIGALDIDDFSASKSVSLGEIVQNDVATQAIFTPLDGTTNIFPEFGPFGGGEYTVDPFTNYTSVTFSSGTIFLTITNNLPVEITTLSVTIKDSNDSIICVLDYLSIPPNGGSQVNNVDLTDRGPFSNQFRAEMTNIYTVGSSGPVDISLSDELILDIFSENVKISSGTTILPDQIFGYDSSMVDFDLDGPEKIYEIILETGRVDYTVTSNIQEDILVKITLPATKINGDTLVFEELITYNGGNPTSGSLNLDNSITDLTTDPLKPYNVFPFKFEVEIVSSNNQVTINFDDDFTFEFSVNNIDFAYIEGCLGKQEETVDPDSLEIDDEILDKISGTFQFANPTIKFTYRNSFGLPVSLDLSVEGEFNDGSIVDLGESVIDVQYPIDILNPEVEGTIEFDKDDTNIEDLLVFPPPVKIRYSGSATINPSEDTTVINFVTNKSKIEGDLEIEIPIEFSASNLTFEDTVDIDFDDEDTDFNFEDIEFTKIYLNIKNGFPLDLRFQMIPLDSITSAPCDTLEFTFLSAAPVDDNDGIVIEDQVDWNQEIIDIDQEFLDNLEKSDQVIVKVIFNTTGNGANPVKILSDYIFEFNIGVEGKFKFNFNPDEDSGD